VSVPAGGALSLSLRTLAALCAGGQWFKKPQFETLFGFTPADVLDLADELAPAVERPRDHDDRVRGSDRRPGRQCKMNTVDRVLVFLYMFVHNATGALAVALIGALSEATVLRDFVHILGGILPLLASEVTWPDRVQQDVRAPLPLFLFCK
jgi:hypothetical protein